MYKNIRLIVLEVSVLFLIILPYSFFHYICVFTNLKSKIWHNQEDYSRWM
mgnify:CR=1 FL=1|jgi:hypothetical protein